MAWKFFKRDESQPKHLAVLISSLVIIFFLFALVTAPVAAYTFVMRDKIYRGITIDGVPVGALSRLQAKEKLQKSISELVENGIGVRYDGKVTNIKLSSFGLNDPDLAYDLVNFEVDQMVDEAFSYGRDENFIISLREQGDALFSDKAVSLIAEVDHGRLDDVLNLYFSDVIRDGADAKVVFSGDKIEVVAEKSGTQFDVASFDKALSQKLSLSTPAVIDLNLKTVEAQVTKADVDANIDQLTNFLKKDNIVLNYKDKSWPISVDLFKSYVYFSKEDGKVTLNITEDGLAQILYDVAQEVNVSAQDAKMEFKDGRVTLFEPSQDGWEVKIPETAKNIISDIFEKGQSSTEIVIDVAVPKIQVQDLNDLGIKELIGQGISDYSGSPKNRRINIAVGAAAVDGSLILPGEEFSLLKTLGSVDAKNGYKEELVIKGNKTVPEFGGGLCQIGTTTFRGALDSGLKITMRANHSYRVGYYEPAGTDATIYSPAPDFKFLNDTANAVVINTINDTKNSKLYFQFWGTKDGRVTEMTKPVIYNIKKPAATKLIETLELAPGIKRCTESAHAGADAYFVRTITSADGAKNEEKFSSH
jgi:vancomycin resistance protein YoaR